MDDVLLSSEHLLMQEIIKGVNMKSLVNLSAKLLNNPVAFSMLNLTELVYSDNYPKESAEDLYNCRLRSTPEERTKWTEIFNIGIRKCKPVIQSWPYQRYRSLVCGSKVNGTLAGYISIPQVNYPLEEIDSKLIQLVSNVYGVALLLQDSSHIQSSEHSLLLGLLTDRINDNYLNRNNLNPAFGNLKKYRMLWFLQKTADGEILTDLDIYELLNCLTYKLSILFEEGYAVLTDGSDNKQLDVLSFAAKKKNVLIGVSDVFYNAEDTKKNFSNAQNALRYAAITGTITGIAKFDNFKLHHLISIASGNLDLSEYMLNSIKEIEQYDVKNNTEYLNTLRTYLLCNQNVKEAAKALFIHTNTVIYRIKRLREIFEVDLHNSMGNSLLIYSLIIHDYFIPGGQFL
ncbi:MAG: helix-turn-helix domain-containing protein [Tissierellia bacterium]|nr:helix-turn-helix domain-containing protein [Tissierellia bacterium]